MPLRALLLLPVLMAVGLSCASRAAPRPTERRDRISESRADWQKLGERWVDGARDRDVIAVGGREGTFRKVMIVVEHSALEMYDVVVTFRDGDRFSPPTRLMFGPNSRSQVIDLPGNQRVIQSVAFRYGNLPGGGRAHVEVFGR